MALSHPGRLPTEASRTVAPQASLSQYPSWKFFPKPCPDCPTWLPPDSVMCLCSPSLSAPPSHRRLSPASGWESLERLESLDRPPSPDSVPPSSSWVPLLLPLPVSPASSHLCHFLIDFSSSLIFPTGSVLPVNVCSWVHFCKQLSL